MRIVRWMIYIALAAGWCLGAATVLDTLPGECILLVNGNGLYTVCQEAQR